MQKHIDTNFAYANLAVITVGFLLWHSIAIFNLEQDLKALQDNTSSLQGGMIKQSHKDNTKNSQNLIPTEMEESQDTQILYNEDGSIDTSNWKTYTNEEYGFSVKYPQGWEVKEGTYLPKTDETVISIGYAHPLQKNEWVGLHILPRGGFDRGLRATVEVKDSELGGYQAKFCNLMV